MTAREKVIEAEQQVFAMLRGDQEGILCPFCRVESTADQIAGALCCQEMATVANAIIDHLEFKDMCQKTDRVLEHFDKMASADFLPVVIH